MRNDILHLNIFLDKLEMQEFVRSSVHHVIFIITMTHEQYMTSFWWKIVLMIFIIVCLVKNPTTPLFERRKKKVRRELYAQCFDELIRQTTVSGLILIDCLTFHKICFQFLQENLISSKIKGLYTSKIDPEKIKFSSHL